jgi:hypothetical protein
LDGSAASGFRQKQQEFLRKLFGRLLSRVVPTIEPSSLKNSRPKPPDIVNIAVKSLQIAFQRPQDKCETDDPSILAPIRLVMFPIDPQSPRESSIIA